MKKKRKGWIRIIVILLVAALLGGGAYYFYRRSVKSDEGSAYVQSVADITGMGAVGLYAQYNGIVDAKDVIEVNPSANMTVKECFVSTGSKIREGDPLFCYDVDDLKLQHAQILIDITGIENKLLTNREQLASLKKQLEKAKEKDRYEIELNIQTVELDIRKTEYDLSDKQNKAEEMQKLIDASTVYSPVTGTVRSVRDDSGSSDPFGYSGSGSNAYITIIAGTAFCVKGTVNEQTVYTLFVGMPVLIRSRVDDTVYHGTIYRIDTDSTSNEPQGGFYYDGGSDRASKYAFYVEPESIEGLLIGQHVLIDLNTEESSDSGLRLPAAFLINENGNFYVWAANANGRIEKRSVTVGAYAEETESYEILSGLTPKDRIAFPDETVHAGMLATETAFTDPTQNGTGLEMPFPPDNGNDLNGNGIEMPILPDSIGEDAPQDSAEFGFDTVEYGVDTVDFGG